MRICRQSGKYRGTIKVLAFRRGNLVLGAWMALMAGCGSTDSDNIPARFQPLAQAGQVSYGFGMGVGKGLSLSGSYYALKILGHDGAILGYSSLLFCIPERDFCFISLANADPAQIDLSKSLAVAVQTLVDLPAPTSKPDMSPRPDLYPSYVGTFVDPFVLGTVEITTDGSKLFIQVDSLDSTNVPYSHELQPTILNDFTMTVNGEVLTVTFIVDSEGKYTYIYSRPYVVVRQ